MPRAARFNTIVPALIATGAVATTALVGAQASPRQLRAGIWYASLRKPRYTPSGPVIGSTWIVLYGLIALAGTRLMRQPASPRRTASLSAWAATLAGIALFPHEFFGRRDLAGSGIVTSGLLASTIATTAAAARIDRTAAIAMSPTIAWVGFALLLNEELWRRN